MTAAGAFLAVSYTASANDIGTSGSGLVDVSQLGDTSAASTDETTTDAGTTSEAQETTTEEAAPPPPPETTTAEVPVEDPPPVTVTDPGPPVGGTAPPPPPQPVIKTKHKNRPAETGEGAHATVWIHLTLPDPTPPAMRLDPAFARRLGTISRAAGVHWWLVLAVVRAHGGDTRVPASSAELRRIAARLAKLEEAHGRWAAVLAISHGQHAFANQVMALARYDRAVGLRALVEGLEAAKPRLERKMLLDRRIDIYPGGRADIALHRIDVRVLVLIRYLRVTFKQVTVSSLFSSHRYYARPGVVSAHMYGLAADISAVAKTPISGHQQPGGMTQRALKAILRLPAEVQPQQLISLLGLGGPSFPQADHYDHIHVGF